MKALLVNEFCELYDELHVAELPPPQISLDSVLIKVVAAGVNFVDTLYARGKHQNNRSLVRPPFILGLEFSGIVVSSPPNFHFKIGDAVFGDYGGSYSEYISLPADTTALRRVPHGWKVEDAAGLAATLPVSYGALVLAGQLKAGETVLIHAAAGGLGIMAVQVAVAMGCRVIGTASSSEKCEYATNYGAAICINYTQGEWWDRVLAETGGKGVDVVFDPVGVVDRSLKCVAHRGRIVVVGFAGTEGQIEKIATNKLLLKQVSLIGYRYGESLRRHPHERNQIWDGLASMLESQKIRPVVSRYYDSLNSVPLALSDIARRKILGKGVIVISPSEENNSAKL